jgi:diguanylate cyclase (GGDEF)-like protein/PAS domain S-box-containing protein
VVVTIGTSSSGSWHGEADLLKRIAGTVAIMLYQMELRPDGSFHCLEFIGLETILGPTPEGVSPEDAYDAAVHPDDRVRYEAALDALWRGEPVDVEYRLIRSDGQTRWVLDRMRPEAVHGGEVLVDGVVADITDRKRAEEDLVIESQKLAHLAAHDVLTGLPNRLSFQQDLELALYRAERTGSGLAVLFVDLDNFKLVNDSYGHAAGDELLRVVGSRLRKSVRKTDAVARQGGDEFLIFLSDLKPEGESDHDGFRREAEIVAGNVRRVLRAPIHVHDVEIYISASVGISLFPGDASNCEALLKHADVAMYSAKDAGRDGQQVYELEADTALELISVAGRLRKALEHGRDLALRYQPIVDLETEDVVGVEALLHWHDRERVLAPDDFIPLAERIGLMGMITDWVVPEACRQAAGWQARGLDLCVSINLPPSYFHAAGMGHVLSSARAAGVPLDRLMVEVTESALVLNERRQTEDVLKELSKRGLKIAIDDFGTGYSSLGRLNTAWVSTLKIDRSFIADLPGSEQARRLVGGVVQLAHTLGFDPVAEGIETERQRRFLLDLGCRLGQGFLFSPAVPADEVEGLCAGNGTRPRRIA